jgi:hypothetical protein
MAHSAPAFTRQEMTGYYVIKTEYVCTHCCAVASSVISTRIMVEYLDGDGKPASIPLTTLLDRYVKINEYRINADQAFARLPELPFFTKTFEEEVTFCETCLPPTFGSSEPDAFPTMLPAPQPIKSGPVYSENVPDPRQPPQTPRQTSRKIKRETPEEKAKRERLAAIKRGDISSLL